MASSADAQPANPAGGATKGELPSGQKQAVPSVASPAERNCAGVSFAKNLKYGPAESNVLDVANLADNQAAQPRPVLVFVAGDSFVEQTDSKNSSALLNQAMCIAARNNLVAVKISYRLAPKHQWPAAARDVAAAVSWLNDNVDLFNGDRNQIIAIGYSVGAFHLASSLAHPDLRIAHSNLAGIVLLSGFYRIGIHSSSAVKAYVGNDAAKYKQSSIFPGILFANDPFLIAWSVKDSRQVVAESEELKALICEARRGVCPRHEVLQDGGSMSSVITLLGEPIRSLIRQIESRGLP
jgi:acetyl esterase/lipase